MKATLSWVAAVLVSTLSLTAASAQSPYQNPYPEVPAGYGYPGYGPGESTSNYGGAAKGCAGGNCGGGAGGCSTCGGKDGGKHKIFDYLCCVGCPGCQKPELFHKKGCSKCGGMCGAFKGFLCKPCPSDAPVLWHAQYPLGFPTHPYVRSPRDYFMDP